MDNYKLNKKETLKPVKEQLEPEYSTEEEQVLPFFYPDELPEGEEFVRCPGCGPRPKERNEEE